jgi:SPASM domain peptide maturase of grasp-with-spasm system
MNSDSKKYRLNPDAFLTKGTNRSIISDIGRRCSYFIPNALFEILTHETCLCFNALVEKYGGQSPYVDEVIREYFSFLLEKDLIFDSNSMGNYKNVNLEWDYPGIISNAIIDIGHDSAFEFDEIFQQLIAIGCVDIQIRFFVSTFPKTIENEILKHIRHSRIKSIELLLPSQEGDNSLLLWRRLIGEHPQIKYIQLYGASRYEVVKEGTENGMGYIVLVEDVLENELSCGVVSSHYFLANIFSFTESHHHNSCLNRKISIDAEGNIKNCPSMKESYGNIRDTTLMEALEKPGFKKYWNLTKDQVSVCKDCEFRYICTDCRAYLEDPEDIYSKPLKCGYNPYTCEWEEWSTNPLKQQAIDYYGMREILPEFARQKPSDAPSSDAP